MPLWSSYQVVEICIDRTSYGIYLSGVELPYICLHVHVRPHA